MPRPRPVTGAAGPGQESMNGDERRDSGYISPSELHGAARAVRPRDAATLIIVRNDGARPSAGQAERQQS